jgi:CHAT domain-containing protein
MVKTFAKAGMAAVLVLLGLAAQPAAAQVGDRGAPSTMYYTGFGPLYDGDYLHSALRIFQSEGRSSIKTPQSRWIDSICYETMCGECYFQMGIFDKALAHYTSALQLYKAFPTWMAKVQFQPIRPAGASTRKAVPWGASTRQSPLGTYPTTMHIMQGQTYISSEQLKQGGVYQPANLYPVTPQEIIRATALAMRRRAALLGPVAKHDPLTNEIIVAISQQIGPPNHWSEAWTNLERGLALRAGGKDSQALPYLQRAVLAGGEFDHPLTSIALLELGRMALEKGDYPGAAKFFDEATYAAVNYPDYGVLEEAFRYGLQVHLMSNQKGFFKPLEGAIQWAKMKSLRQLRASLLLSAAENYAVLGESQRAEAMLKEARTTIGRRDMLSGAIGARLSYLGALVAYQQKRTAEGNTNLASAMSYMNHGSLRLFQMRMADDLYVGGTATARMAMDLFNDVLRDPQPADWAADPMETLAALITPHPLPMEHWFEVAVERRDTPSAVEIADRARHHRFFCSLELGGRVETLRWILDGPMDALPQQAKLQRQDILGRYPAYEQLKQQTQAIRDSLVKKPLVAEDQAESMRQTKALDELAKIAAHQEAILREIAVRREPATMVFPPLGAMADMQKNLPPKHAVLGFFATSRRMYGFLLNNERHALWQIGPLAPLAKQTQTLLREMGNYQQSSEIALKDLGDKWKQSAKLMLDMLLKGSQADFTQNFDELAIVPDGILWYLPFDALQVMVDKEPQPLISRFRIRYAPTLSLATLRGGVPNPTGNTAVVLGKLFPRHEDAVARKAFDQLAAVAQNVVALRSPPPAPTAIYGTLFHRLLVLDDIPVPDQDPYGWSPAPLDRGKPGSTLADWFLLPWGGPTVVVLPGYHTSAEDSLKRLHKGLPGNDVFLSVCGLMANGARTILLSRWRTGGQTSFDLTREFIQELPHTSPADSWQRAVQLTLGSRLNVEAEPRLKRATLDEIPKAEHPFFWAGYMLVDPGAAVEQPQPKTDQPAEKPKKPAPGEKDDKAKPAKKAGRS